jgi:hypothetical protein
MTRPPLFLAALTSHSFQARQDGYEQFVVRETTEGWKTEGNPEFDGRLWPTRDALVAELEGRNR